jgi:hypothetical protein
MSDTEKYRLAAAEICEMVERECKKMSYFSAEWQVIENFNRMAEGALECAKRLREITDQEFERQVR